MTIKTMLADTTIRARINSKIKDEATAVLEAMGLTASDAFRMLMVRIATDKKMPFNPLIPNQETLDAIKEARAGKFISECDADQLINDLNKEGDNEI